MEVKTKRHGFALETKTFEGKDHQTYLVFRTSTGEYHVFVEVEAKEAARQCGAKEEGNMRQMWASVWSAS